MRSSRHMSDRATLVLISLAGGDRHAYALNKDIQEFAGVKIGPGTLYNALRNLELDGLIERLEHDGRRCPYRITHAGREALTVQLTNSTEIASVGLQRMALRSDTPTH